MNLKAASCNFQETAQTVCDSSTKAIHEPLLRNYARNVGDAMIVARSSGGDGHMSWKVIFGIVFGLVMFFGLLAAFYFIIKMKLSPPKQDAPPEEIEQRRNTLGRFFNNMNPRSREPDERSSYAATSSAGYSSFNLERNFAIPQAPPTAHVREYARHNELELTTMPTSSNNLPRTI